MSLQQYYNDFRTGAWAEPEPENCLCRGHGWALSDVDTWHECPIHYKGQRHPEDQDYDDVVPTPSPPIPYTPCTDEDIPF